MVEENNNMDSWRRGSIDNNHSKFQVANSDKSTTTTGLQSIFRWMPNEERLKEFNP